MPRNTAQKISLLDTNTALTSTSIPDAKKELVLDASEIKRLKRIKLLSIQQYFYFALLASYKQANPSVDREWFCEEWGILEDDFDLLLAQLEKKGALTCKRERHVQLSLFDVQEQD
ncbi:hypothetical protein G7B40_041470 [Aetokthonos hydrillicola Thurmond2011]|jgi:hypothetical protein|uniref:Uncharacterized protein n=1 Tax=Aetokthonos hydrillicola Thurmond2011 TaxID=2712845 RepID=A0AAP5MA96_9CYAN|nr:hypothetical protein [Aetokthonos hydrillicola]MBO3463073.1 hypothetical protein [Aetokthonos hydrillicola CCALA 1050]MDR9900936.1 hypothetical protein [Aetokthonos hydrillicola Thurmond2011]